MALPFRIRYKLELVIEPCDENGLTCIDVRVIEGVPGDLLGAQRIRLPEQTDAATRKLRDTWLAIAATAAFGEVAQLLAANGWILERPRR